MSDGLNVYSACEGVRAIKSGELTSEQLVQSCLERIDLKDNEVNAWEFVNKEFALQQARKLDRQNKTKPLHGVPIGIKDIVDTEDMPTAYGSPIYSGHQPDINANCIKRLKDAGAVILGKTVTTEFAYLNPGKTRNPHNIEYTPGGSSSGSAAAVADYHVPLALGTQTAGSIIRPASYCGVIGYKPTYDSFSFEGIHPFASSFDTLGGFARSVVDIVLLRSVLGDEENFVEFGQPHKIALIKGPYWAQAEPETQEMLDQIEGLLTTKGATIERVELNDFLKNINDAQKTIMLSECIQSLGDIYSSKRECFSEQLLTDYEYALTLDEKQVLDARQILEKCKQKIAHAFVQYDLILTSSSPGSAPEGLGKTGDPVFNRMWTAMELPCISLPFPRKKAELPLGVQLVGPVKGDANLLAHALWLEKLLK